MKILDILRHAKSSWDNPTISDFERPLNKRGKNDAPMMGDIFKKLKINPDLIISSPAKRAITTAKLVSEKIDYSKKKIIEDEKIYNDGTTYLFKLINGLDNKISRVLLVGHNPDFTELVNRLSSGFNLGNMPTCGLVSIKFVVDDWQAVVAGSGNVITFEYPKKYK